LFSVLLDIWFIDKVVGVTLTQTPLMCVANPTPLVFVIPERLALRTPRTILTYGETLAIGRFSTTLNTFS